MPSLQILERIAGTLGVDLAELVRTGYDETASPASSTLKEIIYLAEGMTEAKRRLALDLLPPVKRLTEVETLFQKGRGYLKSDSTLRRGSTSHQFDDVSWLKAKTNLVSIVVASQV